jgi:DNA-binding MarR family transcriptional regulator
MTKPNERPPGDAGAEPPETQDFALESFLPYRLSLLSNTISEGIATAYRDVHGLSLTEWRVVAILGRFPDLTATDIMARGAMDKVPVSRAVVRLEERGLVRRKADSEDRRRLTLRLTARGVKLFNAVVPEALAYERQLLGVLGAEEKAQLDGLLTKLLTSARALNANHQR